MYISLKGKVPTSLILKNEEKYDVKKKGGKKAENSFSSTYPLYEQITIITISVCGLYLSKCYCHMLYAAYSQGQCMTFCWSRQRIISSPLIRPEIFV